MTHPSKPFNTTLATTIKHAGRLAAGGAWPRDGPLLANARPSKLHQQGLYACVCLQGLMVSRGVHASMRTRAWSMRARSKPPCLPSPSPKVVVERTINYICKHIEIETCGFQDLAPLAGPRREAGILCAQAYLLRKPTPDCVQKDAGLLSNFENYRRARHSIVPGASGDYCICAATYESRTE